MAVERTGVLVTAIGGGGHGEQILKALRLAGKERYFIIGADTHTDCPQFDLVDEPVILPSANAPEYIDAALEVCRSSGARVAFHGCEPELKRMSAERERFAQQGILLPINPAGIITTCMNKEATNRVLQELGFDPPRYLHAKSIADLRQIDWYPVVVKPSVGGGGSANCYIAQDSHELLALAGYLRMEEFAATFIIQEYVGTPSAEYTVGVLFDMEGNLINSIAVRRLLTGQLNIRVRVPNRTGRTDLGEQLVISSGVSQGHVGRFPEVTTQCEQIAAALGARGAINIQCRLVDDKVKVFEINPRFSGTTSLRALMGYNEPDVLIRRHVLGETIEQHFAYDEGLVLRGLHEYRIDRNRRIARWNELR